MTKFERRTHCGLSYLLLLTETTFYALRILWVSITERIENPITLPKEQLLQCNVTQCEQTSTLLEGKKSSGKWLHKNMIELNPEVLACNSSFLGCDKLWFEYQIGFSFGGLLFTHKWINHRLSFQENSMLRWLIFFICAMCLLHNI